MTTAPTTPSSDTVEHRRLGVDLFNGTWRLLERDDRTRADDDRMLHMAHASRFHWEQVGTATNLARAYELDAGNPVVGYNLARLLYTRGELGRSQFYIRRLNNSELANAESLWLGIKVERKLGDRTAMTQLADQLRRRYPQSRELSSYERGAFDDCRGGGRGGRAQRRRAAAPGA